jgi:hypothetical protein
MTKADEYYTYARECRQWASSAKSGDQREQSIGGGLVEYWLEMAAAEEAVTDEPAIARRRRAGEDQ